MSPKSPMLLLKTVSIPLGASLGRSLHSHLCPLEQSCVSAGKACPPAGIPDGPSPLSQTQGFRDPATPAEDWNSRMGSPSVTRSEMGTLNSLLHLLFSGTNGSEVQPCDRGRGNEAGDGPSLPRVGASKMLLHIVPAHSWLSRPPCLLLPPTQLTGARQRGRSASGGSSAQSSSLPAQTTCQGTLGLLLNIVPPSRGSPWERKAHRLSQPTQYL